MELCYAYFILIDAYSFYNYVFGAVDVFSPLFRFALSYFLFFPEFFSCFLKKKYFHIFALSIPDLRYSLRPLSHSFLDTPTFPPVLTRVFFPHPFPKMIRRNQFFCSFYSDKKKKLFFGVCCRFPSFTRCDFVDSFFFAAFKKCFFF